MARWLLVGVSLSAACDLGGVFGGDDSETNPDPSDTDERPTPPRPGQPVDEDCELGVDALCTCLDVYETDDCRDFREELLADCEAGDPDAEDLVLCYADRVINGKIDCYAAAEACVGDVP